LFGAGLPNGTGGFGLKTTRPALWRRPVERLDQSQEQDASGNVEGVFYNRGARQDMLSRDRSLPPPPDREPDLNAGAPWSEMALEDLLAAGKREQISRS